MMMDANCIVQHAARRGENFDFGRQKLVREGLQNLANTKLYLAQKWGLCSRWRLPAPMRASSIRAGLLQVDRRYQVSRLQAQYHVISILEMVRTGTISPRTACVPPSLRGSC